MNIAVIGSTGRTGKKVIDQAVARGHHVVAVARHPEAVTSKGRDLTVRRADATDAAAVVAALAGCDAVISALGIGASREPTTVYSAGISNVLAGMTKHSIGTVAVVSAAPVGDRAEQPFMERRIVMPVLDRFFGASYQDMRIMESILRDSDVAWTSLRPPRLLDKAGTGVYRIQATKPLPNARSLTYADLATSLLDCLERSDLHRHICYVAN